MVLVKETGHNPFEEKCSQTVTSAGGIARHAKGRCRAAAGPSPGTTSGWW